LDWFQGISDAERELCLGNISRRSRLMHGVLGKLPHWMVYAYVRYMVVPKVGSKWVENATNRLCAPDAENIQQLSGHIMERSAFNSSHSSAKCIFFFFNNRELMPEFY
jgi:hypothetical protein